MLVRVDRNKFGGWNAVVSNHRRSKFPAPAVELIAMQPVAQGDRARHRSRRQAFRGNRRLLRYAAFSATLYRRRGVPVKTSTRRKLCPSIAEDVRLIDQRDQLAGQNDRLRRLIRQLQCGQFRSAWKSWIPNSSPWDWRISSRRSPRRKPKRRRMIRRCGEALRRRNQGTGVDPGQGRTGTTRSRTASI